MHEESYFFIPELSAIQGESCGLAILPAGWQHHTRTLNVSVLILGLQGSLELALGTKEFSVEPGSFCLLPAGLEHRGCKPAETAVRYFWLHFTAVPQACDPALAKQILASPDIARQYLADALVLPLKFSLEPFEGFLAPFRDILAEWQQGSFSLQAFHARVRLFLIKLTEGLIQKPLGKDPVRSSNLTENILQQVYENLNDASWSVKALAQKLAYHPDYLNRHFRRVMGQNLNDYILDRRIDLAIRYLCYQDNSLAEIAALTGFASYRSFVRQFRKRTGRIPSEYRWRMQPRNLSQ